MAESITTKLTIGKAFRSLMAEIPFSKISIGDICQKCDMNRKSFYYHFKDKYDLMNWIFDNEFPYLTEDEYSTSISDTLNLLCRYFYENRSYYKKVFEIEGQNSFSDYLYNKLFAFIKLRSGGCDDFQAHFWADALLCSLKDWLLNKYNLHYNDFYRRLRSCISSPSLLSIIN